MRLEPSSRSAFLLPLFMAVLAPTFAVAQPAIQAGAEATTGAAPTATPTGIKEPTQRAGGQGKAAKAAKGAKAAKAAKKTKSGSGEAGADAAQAAAAPTPLAPATLKKLGEDLFSTATPTVDAAAKALGDSRDPAAAGPLHEVLAAGTHPLHLPAMLAALGRIKNPDSISILVLYSGNRNVNVRLAAIVALATFPGEQAQTILHARLGDPAEPVRAAAATALAERKDASAVERLYALLSRGDAGAAAPLGQLASVELVPRVAELRGRIIDGALATCLGEFLKRPEAPDRLRLDIVRTLGRIPGADATAALIEFIASLPEENQSTAKTEALALIEQRGSV